MDFGPNLEENYPRLQKLLVLVGSLAMTTAPRKKKILVFLAELGVCRTKGTLSRPLLTLDHKSFVIKQVRAISNLQK